MFFDVSKQCAIQKHISYFQHPEALENEAFKKGASSGGKLRQKWCFVVTLFFRQKKKWWDGS